MMLCTCFSTCHKFIEAIMMVYMYVYVLQFLIKK